MILTVGGIKGGTGKTTIATNLAVLNAKEGNDVLLVDADEQGSASKFVERRNEATGDIARVGSVRLYGKAVKDEVFNLRPKYDTIVIDIGGRDTTSQRAAMAISDMLLLPFVPQQYDIETVELMEELVSTMRVVNPKMKVYSMLNRSDPRGDRGDMAADILQEMTEEIKYLNCRIGTRMAFGDAAASGLSVVEALPRNAKAIGEIEYLYSCLFHSESN